MFKKPMASLHLPDKGLACRCPPFHCPCPWTFPPSSAFPSSVLAPSVLLRSKNSLQDKLIELLVVREFPVRHLISTAFVYCL